jgi:sugar phosphate isomerase/epimerase
VGASHQALDRFRGPSQGPSGGVSPQQRFIFRADSSEEAEEISQGESQRRSRRDPKDAALVAKALEKLRKRMKPFWAQTQASAPEVFDSAEVKGVKLSFETRAKFEELPLDADYADFVAGLPEGSPAGYWHDPGRADIKQTMGLLDHRVHLTKNAPRLIGFHLRDVSASGQDHQPIGSGHIDIKRVSEFWRPGQELVLELSPRVKPEDVLRSKENVEALLAAAPGF